MNDVEQRIVTTYKRLLFGIGIFCAFIILISFLLFERVTVNKDVTIGLVLQGSHIDGGYNEATHKAMVNACNEMDVRLVVEENVFENKEECSVAVKRLVEKGAGAIIMHSSNYAPFIIELKEQYPEVHFFCNYSGSDDFYDGNSYSVRMYQARYLAGILAGLETETGKIGYVAAMENSEVLRGLNAFALGVRKVNPDAEIVVGFTGIWGVSPKEVEVTEQLILKEDIDVISFHQNANTVVDVAEKYGIKSVGFHYVKEDCTNNYLGVVCGRWEHAYKDIIKDCINGQVEYGSHYWPGLEEDAVELVLCSENIPGETVQLLEETQKRIIEKRDVFSGKIIDNQGNEICAENETISDEVLLYDCTWFVEGIKVYEQ